MATSESTSCVSPSFRIGLSRRRFLWMFSASANILWIPRNAAAQLQPFELTLRRDRDLATTLNLNDCVTGKLYRGAVSLSDPGMALCDTLELPYRNELNEISCIKPGSYSAFVRTGKTAEGVDLGWRLQLERTKQLAIQIHT
jgi:hypothetical protein